MANTYSNYTGNGSNRDFNVLFPYLSQAHTHVYVNGVVDLTFTWNNATQIKTTSTPANGVNVLVKRITPTTPLTDFVDSSTLGEADLDRTLLQSLYVAEETNDAAVGFLGKNGGTHWDAEAKRITNLVDGTTATDAATKGQLDAASIAAGNVPSPTAGNSGKWLKALTATTWGWTSLAWADISDLVQTNIAAISGWLGLQTGAFTTVGTAATKNTGTAAGQIPLLVTGGKLPVVDGSNLTGLSLAPSLNVSTKAGAYSLAAGDKGTELEFTTAGVTLTMLAAGTAGNGFLVTVRNSAASGDITLSGNVDGIASRKLRPGDIVQLRSDGTVWKTVAGAYSFVSAEQALAMGTLYTVAHGLGVMPNHIRVVQRCKIAELGWSIGDEHQLSQYDMGTSYGGQISANATNIDVISQQTYQMAAIRNRSSPAATGAYPTVANWRYVIYAKDIRG